MSINYKIDIIDALKNKGYSTYRIRKERIFGESTVQDFRKGKVVLSVDCLEKLCKLLECQPADLFEYVEDSETTE